MHADVGTFDALVPVAFPPNNRPHAIDLDGNDASALKALQASIPIASLNRQRCELIDNIRRGPH
jgi:hypothetical protein